MENDVDVLDWSSQSPDANPIENFWALLKLKLHGKNIWNIEQLYRHIQLTRRTFSQEYAIKLVESMGQRCEAIIDNGQNIENKAFYPLYCSMCMPFFSKLILVVIELCRTRFYQTDCR
jgi:hypothetical protein